MLHIAAFYADVMTMLTEQGHPVADAVQIATSAIAMAGTELYDSEDQADDGHAALAEQLRAFLAHFHDDNGSDVIDYIGPDHLTVGMLRDAAAALGRPRHHPARPEPEVPGAAG